MTLTQPSQQISTPNGKAFTLTQSVLTTALVFASPFSLAARTTSLTSN